MRKIYSLEDLSRVVTDVVNRIVEVATENTSSGQYYVGHEHVADLISEEDFLQYFDFIEHELWGREEILDLATEDKQFDVVCGLAWCKNYEPQPEDDLLYGYEELRHPPSMAHMAKVGEAVIKKTLEKGREHDLMVDDLGIEEEDISFVRSTLRVQEAELLAYGAMPLSDYPLVRDHWDLGQLLEHAYEEKARGSEKQIFEVCVNNYGQVVSVPKEEEKRYHVEQLQKILSEEKPASHANRAGAMVYGQPAVWLTHAVIGQEVPENGMSGNLLHAQTQMMTSQCSRVLAAYKPSLCPGFESSFFGPEGPKKADEIHAFVPVWADRNVRVAFEKDFEKTIKTLPLSRDPSWVKWQYKTILSFIAANKGQWPLNQENIGKIPAAEIAIRACGVLGEAIGEIQWDFDRATARGDTAALKDYADKVDLTKNTDLLEACVSHGAHLAYMEAAQQRTLYTKPPEERHSPADGLFRISRGDLRSILNEMGYDKDCPLHAFMAAYDYDTAKEIKAVFDSRQKLPLDQQVGRAEQKKNAAARPQPERGAEPER